MRLVLTGYGNSGQFHEAQRKAIRDSVCEYLVLKTSGIAPGMIGGSFNYDIHETDSLDELSNPEFFHSGSSVMRRKNGEWEWVEVKKLAAEYVAGLPEEKRRKLIDEMLVKYLTK